jgi:hypothetical protein
MPLKPGKTPKIMEQNLKELIKDGKPPKQALAIMYDKAGMKDKSMPYKHGMKSGG